MEFYEVIQKRRSIRNYIPDKEIPEDVLKRILDSGRIAPSAANRQPWKFIVVRRPDIKKKLSECYKGDWLKDAPAILVVLGYKDRAWVRSKDGYNSITVDLTIALDHMILAAAAEGVGSCWILAFDYEILKNVLKVKESEFVACISPLGYPRDADAFRISPQRKNLEEVVEIID
jgi:nitroreductase